MKPSRSRGFSGLDGALVGATGRALHLLEQALAGGGRVDVLEAAILLALQAPDQSAARQASHDVGQGGAIDADLLGKGGLLEPRAGRPRRSGYCIVPG